MTRAARIVVLVSILALGLWLRARHVDTHGLWLDELGTLWTIRADTVGECLARVRAIQGQTAAYYLLARATTLLLGESEVTLRLPSLLFGAMLPLLAFLALAPIRRDPSRDRRGQCASARARRAALAFGPRAGIAAAIALGANTHLVFHSHQARPYALAGLGTLLAYVGLSRVARGGRLRDRALLWGGALLAAYAHTLFAPVLVAAGLGALVARSPRYPLRTASIDGAIAAVLAIPFALAAYHVFTRRSTLGWARGDASIVLVLAPGALAVLGIAATFALARWVGRPSKEASPEERGRAGEVASHSARSARSRASSHTASRALLAFELTTALTPVAVVIGMGLLGTNLYHTRYLLLTTIGVTLLAARLIGRLPWPAAALALACLLLAPGAQIPRRSDFWTWPEWREATRALDELGFKADDPIVLRPGFVESEKVLEPPYTLDPMLKGFVASPLEHPGRPPGAHPHVLILPFTRGINRDGEDVYYEQVIAARLSQASRFFVVADAKTELALAGWLEWRFPGKFQRTSGASPFRDLGGAQGVVTRYDLRR